MKLENFATDLVSKNHFIKASFGGFQGAGKTRTATEFVIGAYKDLKCSKPVLILDNEKGSRFLIPIFNKAGIKAIVKDTRSLSDVKQAFNFLNNKEIGFLFIDSLTKIYYQFVKDYKAKNRKTYMSLMDWGKLLPAWQEEFSDVFVEAEGNIVFTGRGGFEYEKEEDQKDEAGNITEKGSFVKSGVKMKIAGETPYETDLNIWMQLEKELKNDKPVQTNVAYVLKDRSDTINAKSFSMPKYRNFKPVIRFIQGLEVGEIAGESTHDNLTPGDDLDYWQRKQEQKIALEKIEAVFDENGFGDARSKADKQLKAVIIKKVFGTTSKTEIEKMKASQLTYLKESLEQLFIDLKDNQPENPIEFLEAYNLEEAA